MTRDIVLIVDAETDEVLGHVDGRTPDLALVEALARVQLGARRRGGGARLANASARPPPRRAGARGQRLRRATWAVGADRPRQLFRRRGAAAARTRRTAPG